MGYRSTTKGWRILAALAILVGLSGAPAAATLSMQHTYRTGIDVGNDPATGCDFSLGSVAPNNLPGFELQVTVVVDADLMPPQVVSAEVETCSGDGGSFGGAQTLPGFVLEVDSGLLGSDSIVGAIPSSLLGDAVALRLAHYALSGEGAEDALFTRDGSEDGAAITVLLGGAAPAPLLSGLGIGLAVLLLFGIGFGQWRNGRWGEAAVLVIALGAIGTGIAYAAFGDPAAVDDPADAAPPDSRAEIVASFVMLTDSELGLRLDIENIAFVPPTPTATDSPTATATSTETDTPTATSTPTATATDTATATPSNTSTATATSTATDTPTPNQCAGLDDGTTCDAGMDGVVLTCVSQICGPCVPTGTCSTTATTTCAFDEDCPGVETCSLTTPSPRYVDNGDQTVTDRQTCLVWEKKTGTVGSFSPCPGGANCGDPHNVNNRYTWSISGTAFDGGAKTLFLDALNDVGGGGINCFAGHCDWRLPSSGGSPAGSSGEAAELESIVDCSGGAPCVAPIFGPTASDFYWSSTTSGGVTLGAWSVFFTNGDVDFNGKAGVSYVRAVRGGS